MQRPAQLPPAGAELLCCPLQYVRHHVQSHLLDNSFPPRSPRDTLHLFKWERVFNKGYTDRKFSISIRPAPFPDTGSSRQRLPAGSAAAVFQKRSFSKSQGTPNPAPGGPSLKPAAPSGARAELNRLPDCRRLPRKGLEDSEYLKKPTTATPRGRESSDTKSQEPMQVVD